MVEISCCSCLLVPSAKGVTKSCLGWELSLEVDRSAVGEEGDSARGEVEKGGGGEEEGGGGEEDDAGGREGVSGASASVGEVGAIAEGGGCADGSMLGKDHLSIVNLSL